MTRLRGPVAKTVIVIVNLVNALLQNRHDIVKGAKTIRIVLAARVGSIYWNHGVVPALLCQ